MHEYRVQHVSKVTNGDTLQLIVDLGFHLSAEISVHLLGVRTPEFGVFDRQGVDQGQEARNFTVNWLKMRQGYITVHTERDRRDGFQRWLGMVYADDGACLNEVIVSEGLATDTVY